MKKTTCLFVLVSMVAVVVAHHSYAQASYANAKLNGMDFSGQYLAGANFSNAHLEGAHFAGANLEGAHFPNASLQGADFSNADMRGASLVNAILDGANLNNTDLSQADLRNASLNQTYATGTRFNGAALQNVDMSHLIRQIMVPAAPVPVPVQVPVPAASVVDARAIASALTAVPANPQEARHIDLTVNFDFNSDKLTNDGQLQVREIAGALNASGLQNSRILVEGHTDNVGSDSYNKDLSYRRALQVVRILSGEYGISEMRLSAQGYGKSHPIASNDSDFGRAKNRRVTIVNMGS